MARPISPTEPVAREHIAEEIEQLEALDRIGEALQGAVRTLVPDESRLKDVLSGTWLGHPLHPPLTDVVVGSWAGALMLDLVAGADAEDAADLLVLAGVLGAVPTAAAGLSDWADLRGGSRRVGVVHALGNTSALTLHAVSWAQRRRGRRTSGVALSVLGFAIAGFSAWLGGHLSFGKGVGVNQTAFLDAPEKWTRVYDAAALEEGSPAVGDADGVPVLLVRRGRRLHALADRCSHRGCGLHEGALDDDTITCPCHGSTFRLADGSIVKGPATAPQPVYDVRTHGDAIEIRERRV